MIYRSYGKTGKKVSLIGMGTVRLSPSLDDFSNNVDLIHRALDLGVNYFDTAPTYASGMSEKILGAAFQERRGQDFMVVSKSMLSMEPTADDVLRRIESSLRTLHVDKINFFHMWSVLTGEQYRQIIAPGGPYEGALKAKKQGLIDHICVSVHCSGAELEQIIRDGMFDGVTLGFNALNYRHRLEGLRLAGSKGMGIAIMNPLGGGLIPRNPAYFQNLCQSGGTVVDGAIQFVAAHLEVSTILIGVSSDRDLREAVQAVEEAPALSAEQWREVADRLPAPGETLCTMCDYCQGCPADLPVSRLMGAYNEYLLSCRNETHFHEWRKMYYGAYPFETASCIKCGRCESKCTQHLPIMDRIETMNDICRREADKQRALCVRYFPNTGYPRTGIYGMSITAETLLKAYQNFYGGYPRDTYYFDSNPAKWGTELLDLGQIIQAPEEIRKLDIRRIIIAAPKYEVEIRAFLKDYVTEETEIYAL